MKIIDRHKSCSPEDLSLMWVCEQCGYSSAASDIKDAISAALKRAEEAERDRDALIAESNDWQAQAEMHHDACDMALMKAQEEAMNHPAIGEMYDKIKSLEDALAAALKRSDEAGAALSGRTVSCGNCDALAAKLWRAEKVLSYVAEVLREDE